jgi:hypothetical protein
MADKYAAERGDPATAQCGRYSLLFDGFYLKLQLGSSVAQAWHARSGHAAGGFFDYSSSRQKVANDGPIPEGKYWIQPVQLDNLWFTSDGWGASRITIHPRPATITHGRGGFFVHGGKVFGSAGCIDLAYGMPSFSNVLQKVAPSSGSWWPTQSDCYVPLEVKYGSPKVGFPP